MKCKVAMLITALAAVGFGAVMTQSMVADTAQAATCVPGVRDMEYNGRILNDAWVTCVQTEMVNSIEGYLPIGALVDMEVNGVGVSARVDGYQFTQYPDVWPVETRRPMVYMLSYSGGYASLTPEEMPPG